MVPQFTGELSHAVKNDIPTVKSGVPPQPGTDLFALAEAFDFANVVRGGQTDGQKLLAEKGRGDVVQITRETALRPHQVQLVQTVDLPAGLNDDPDIRHGVEDALQVRHSRWVEQMTIVIIAGLPFGSEARLVVFSVLDTIEVKEKDSPRIASFLIVQYRNRLPGVRQGQADFRVSPDLVREPQVLCV